MLILAILVTASGCWSSKEIDVLAFATSAGVDRNAETDSPIVTVRIVKPEAIATGGQVGLSPERAFWTVSSEGRTVFEATRNLLQLSPKRIFGGHGRLLVIGEDAARQGVQAYLDFIDRDGETRRAVHMLIVRGETAQKFLEAEFELSPAADLGLETQLAGGRAGMGTIAVTLNEFLIALETPGLEPVASAAEIVVKIPGGIAGEVERSEVKSSPQVGGTAVFRGDRLVGWLDPLDTRGLMWVTGRVVSTVVVVPCPTGDGEDVTLEILKAKAKMEVDVRGDSPTVSVFVDVGAALAELEAYINPLDWPGSVDQLQALLADAVEGEIRSCLHKCQVELGADVFGFGAAIYRSSPAVWRRIEGSWDDMFPLVPVRISVRAEIRRSGVSGRSLRIR